MWDIVIQEIFKIWAQLIRRNTYTIRIEVGAYSEKTHYIKIDSF